MASVMIVDAERLAETPKAFRDYVERYFREDTCLGKRVFVAARFLDLDPWKHHGPGYAPCHSIHLAQFTDGLKKGQTLYDWMSKARGKHFWEFHGGYDSDNVTNVD